MTPSLSERVRLAAEWLRKTAIRNQEPQLDIFGSVNDGYRVLPSSGQCAYAFTEITGYAISFFVNLGKWRNDARYLKAARQGGDYLLRIQSMDGEETRGAFMHSRDLVSGQPRKEYYAFDAAMCIDGLVDLYQATGDSQYQKAGRLAGQWLVEKMQRSDGSFLALYDADERRFGKTGLEDTWYYDGGCLHAKNAIALLKLAQATGQNRFRDAATRVCDWVLSLQTSDGAFWRNQRKDYVFTHAHCYATEGLIYASHVLEETRYRQAAIKAAEWLLRQQGRQGAFVYEYLHTSKGIKRLAERIQSQGYRALSAKRRSDATAQATRIWMALYCLSNDPRYLEASRGAIDYLCSVQCVQSPDKDRIGGVYHGRADFLLFQRPERVLSSWCTMFAASAMALYDRAEQGPAAFSEAMSELF